MRTIEKGKLFIRALMVLSVALTLALGMLLGMAWSAGAGGPQYDYVDIGDPTSEAGHNLQSWGPIEPLTSGGNWGGFNITGEDCRVVWEPPGGDRCATVELDFGPTGPKSLVLRHLNGTADDSFDVFIDGVLVGHYTGLQTGTENWLVLYLSVDPGLTGVHTVELCATGDAWAHWSTYGQVGFDWIKVCGGECTPRFDYVDIGNPPSEVGHNLLGWGPIEPATNGGNWGGFNVTGEDCRVVWADDEQPPDPPPEHKCATVDLDFGCLEGPKTLVLRHLDGLADDSFDVFIDGVFVGHYTGLQTGTEDWLIFNLSVDPTLTGVHTVMLCATGDAWVHWSTYGQVAFDWIKVCGQAEIYWKAAYPDYAPSGMPDFDQKQTGEGWGKVGGAPGDGPPWTYCGPVAVANCLWWFDSKFEPYPVTPPTINDNYPLVTAYGAWDDHDPRNVVPLVSDLADRMNTDGEPYCAWSGTNIYDMEAGIDDYLAEKGLYRHFYEHTVEEPDFWWIEEELYQSENVILLLGFYWCDGVMVGEPPEWECFGEWYRSGGHYVTVAGVDSENMEIAFSDPFRDNAGLGGPGRIGYGSLIPHTPPHLGDPFQHNDAGNVSHDVYQVMVPSPSPGGLWGLWDYADYDMIENFELVNPHPHPPVPEVAYLYGSGLPIFTEVEKAVVISPKPLLKVEPRHETINVCDEITITVEIIANEMYGVEFDLDFDPTLLEVIDADGDPDNGTQISVGAMWEGKDYLVAQNEVNDGTIEFGATLLDPEGPIDPHDEAVAQIRFHGIGDGVSPLNLNDVIVGALEGESIEPVFLKDGTLTVRGYGTIEGIVEVQGRPGDWDCADITVSGGPGGPYTTHVDNADGTWSISNILAGTYQVEVEMARYLDGLKTGVTVSGGGTTDVGQVKVLGGDCDDDDGPPNGIDIQDAIIVGGAFGSVPGDPNWDAKADINDSDKVDILDAILLGQNWHQSSPVPW